VAMKNILDELDKEISRLKQARSLLAGGTLTGGSVAYENGNGSLKTKVSGTGRGLGLSDDGRRRIAEAMKKRWAERKRQLAKAGR